MRDPSEGDELCSAHLMMWSYPAFGGQQGCEWCWHERVLTSAQYDTHLASGGRDSEGREEGGRAQSVVL